MHEKFKVRVYVPTLVSQDELEIARTIALLAQHGRILLPKRYGFSYAIYDNSPGKTLDHRYYPQISTYISDLDQQSSIEIFIRRHEKNICKLVVKNIENEITLKSGEKIRYSLKNGKDSNLIIYFDYSRLVSKVRLTREFLPKLNFKTNGSVLVFSNSVGFWGTACLFDSSGNPIYETIAKFITELIEEHKYTKVFFVGGSQGGTASIVYSQLINSTSNVYAACPVKISKNDMLRHMKACIGDDEIARVSDIFAAGANSGKVRLFTSVGDLAHHPFHAQLAEENLLASYHVCSDPNVEHGATLRYFIKTIYSDIEMSMQS